MSGRLEQKVIFDPGGINLDFWVKIMATKVPKQCRCFVLTVVYQFPPSAKNLENFSGSYRKAIFFANYHYPSFPAFRGGKPFCMPSGEKAKPFDL